MAEAISEHKSTPQPQSRPKKQLERRQKPQPRKKWLRGTGSRILGLMTVAGFASFLYELRPKIEITTAVSTDSRDSFASDFAIRNKSVFTLKKPAIACYVYGVRTTNNSGIVGGYIEDPSQDPPDIPPEQAAFDVCAVGRMFVAPDGSPSGKITSDADIALSVVFDYLFLRRRKIERRFVMSRDVEGRVLWLEQPVKPHP